MVAIGHRRDIYRRSLSHHHRHEPAEDGWARAGKPERPRYPRMGKEHCGRSDLSWDAGLKLERVDMTNAEIHDFLEQAIGENSVMLFMKGTPEEPRCGFSMRTSGALNALDVRYAALDVLPDPRIREELSAISGWPTIPQLFIDGELVGGCDIVMEMSETGELAQKLGVEMPEDEEPASPEVELPAQSGPRQLENRLD